MARKTWTVEFIERDHLMADIRMESVPGETEAQAEQNARAMLAKDLRFECIACFDPCAE